MDITKPAKAGSLESNDALVYVHPNDESGVKIELTSIVLNQFGEQIKAVAENVVKSFDITRGVFQINDRGALDYVIEARVETAIRRALGEVEA